MPNDVVEADICERFGWTFSELDEEDQDRVSRGFAAQNLRDAVSRIRQWIGTTGKTTISNDDLEIWGRIMKAEEEVKNG